MLSATAETHETELSEGDCIHQRYLLRSLVGEGGWGRVFDAWDQKLHRSVALKFAIRDDAESLARFTREARCTSMASHPNIVAVHDVSETVSGVPFMVMELLEGEDLGVRLSRRRLSIQEIVWIARDVLGGLGEVHAQGVVHRDLKPNNLFLHRDADGSEVVKLVDFGISVAASEPTRLTKEGILVGTPHYLPPEYLQGNAVDARADLYALGAVLYECLTGAPPFDAPTPAAIVAAVLRDGYAPIEAQRPDCPHALAKLVECALSRDPNARYASAAEMQEALAQAVLEPSVHGSTTAPIAIAAVDVLLLNEAPSLNGVPSKNVSEPPLSEPRSSEIPTWRALSKWYASGIAVAVLVAVAAVLVVGAFVANYSGEAAALDQPERAVTIGTPPLAPPIEPRDDDSDLTLENARSGELLQQARAAYIRGDTVEAARRYREVVDLNRSSVAGWRGLCLSAHANGDNRAARAALERYVALAPHAEDAQAIRETLVDDS